MLQLVILEISTVRLCSTITVYITYGFDCFFQSENLFVQEMERASLSAVPRERCGTCAVNTVYPVLKLDLTRRLEEVGVAESGAQTEDVVPFRMLRNGLHYGTVDDDEMFRRRLDGSALSAITRVEE